MVKTKALNLTPTFSKNVEKGWQEKTLRTKTGLVTGNGAMAMALILSGSLQPRGLAEQPHTLIAREWVRNTVQNIVESSNSTHFIQNQNWIKNRVATHPDGTGMGAHCSCSEGSLTLKLGWESDYVVVVQIVQMCVCVSGCLGVHMSVCLCV